MDVITHKHHIIPKHAGGTDDPSNIVELTVEDHAIAHLVRWKMYGQMGDFDAYRILSANVNNPQIWDDKARAAQGERLKKCWTTEKREAFSEKMKKVQKRPEVIEERKRRTSAPEWGAKISAAHKKSDAIKQLNRRRAELSKAPEVQKKRIETYMKRPDTAAHLKKLAAMGNAATSKPVRIDGVQYKSINHAKRELKRSYKTIKKLSEAQ